MPVTGQQPVKSVAARPSFVAEAEPPATFTEPRHHLTQNLGTVLENPELSYFAVFAPMAIVLVLRPAGLFGKSAT